MAEMEIKPNYKENEDAIITTLEKTIGRKTITIGKHKSRITEEVKQLRNNNKTAKNCLKKHARKTRKKKKPLTYMSKHKSH